MAKVVSDYKLYRVKNTKTPVQVAVRVLHGQVGATVARIGTQTPVNEDADSDRRRWKKEWRFSPGSGKDVAGKLLFLTTAVADLRGETDKTGVAYEFAGGVDPFNCTLEESVDEAGGVVVYQLTVDLYT